MKYYRVLVTCPPMIGMLDAFQAFARELSIELVPVQITQTLTESELIHLLPKYDGWIIGDDPATKSVFEAGHRGLLKAAVKWGIGVDNVDFNACHDLGIPVANTPGMFGKEVADLAIGYVIALARHTFEIDRGVRAGNWPKPRGLSLAGRKAAVIGYGDIGRNTVRRLIAADMSVIIYDPCIHSNPIDPPGISLAEWPQRIDEVDFVVVTCALTSSSYHLLNSESLSKMKSGVRIVNVGRGPVIHEQSLVSALSSGHVYSAALDVYEQEPLPMDSVLRTHPRCIFGSHNASNTDDGVKRTSFKVIETLASYLKSKA